MLTLSFATLIIFLSLLSYPTFIFAQVVLDGTLGKSGALPGPDYQVDAELGQQLGGNLFHSFRDFNLQNHESVTFSGPAGVKNVISRVTGGNPSTIDGTLRSTIPEADVYLLNPAGLLFGKNAKLEVQGGFHASTADTLRLGREGQFHARQPQNSLLSVAPPSAFGFVTDSPAPITVQEGNLAVSKGNTLTLVGGNLRITADQFRFNFFHPPVTPPQLSSESGQLNLASVNAAGEVPLPQVNRPIEEAVFTVPGGQIRLQNTWLDVSGEGGGNVYIHGGQLELIDSVISNENGHQTGGTLNIQADNLILRGWQNFSSIYANTWGSGQGGTIRIVTRQLTLTGGAQITSATFGSGEGGSIQLRVADTLTILGKSLSNFKALGYPAQFPKGSSETVPSGIFGNSFQPTANGGKAGKIHIEAGQLILKNGGEVGSGTFGTGDGGTIFIKADTLTLSGTDERDYNSGISADSVSGISADSVSTETEAGNAGDILIEARQMTLTDQALIDNSTSSQGHGGAIVLNVTESLSLQNSHILSESESQNTTGTAGNAGRIQITAGQVTLTDGSLIASDAEGSGQGGSVVLKVDRGLTIQNSYIFSNSFSSKSPAGHAGYVDISAKQVTMTDYAVISSSTFGPGEGGTINIREVNVFMMSGSFILSNSVSLADQAGKAGAISITANQIYVIGQKDFSSLVHPESGDTMSTYVPDDLHLHPGQIATLTNNAEGGNITLKTSNLLYLQDGEISTSAHGRTGNGGDIMIENPIFILLNNSKIQARAEEGKGGNIDLNSTQLLKSSDSLVSASSKLGVDGKITVHAPNENISGSLLGLSLELLNAVNQLKKKCSEMSWEEYENRSKFQVYRLAGSSPWPDDLKPSRLSSSRYRSPPTTGVKGVLQMIPNQVSEDSKKTSQASSRQTVLVECAKLRNSGAEKKGVAPEQLF